MFLSWIKYCVYIISFMFICNGLSDDKSVKIGVVEEIIQKIFNLTSQVIKFANADEKNEILKNIERKLLKSAEPLGSKADKYVKLIMQGLQIMVNNQTQKQNDLRTGALDTYPILMDNNHSNFRPKHYEKDEAVKKVANKLLKLTEKYFRRVGKSGNNKQKIMENIKQKVLESAKQKHDLIHVKHDEIKKYTDLITRGMELMMKKMTQESNTDQRRMIIQFVESGVENKRPKQRNEDENYLYRHSNDLLYKSRIENFNKLEEYDPTEAPLYNEGLTTPLSCVNVFNETCMDIKSLNQYACSNNKILPLNKLCNGIPECADGSDEENCVNQAMERVQTANRLMSRIEIYLMKNCFSTDNNALLIKQNAVLHDVLQRQISFIEKYKNMNSDVAQLRDAYAFKRTLNEVAIVVNTLAMALESSLCIQLINKQKAEEDPRRFIAFDVDHLDMGEKPSPKFSFKSCQCSGSFCAKLPCVEACSRVCWHKYHIGRWFCEAVEEGTSVPLDVVCDGKLDCYDETDEYDCNTVTDPNPAKFVANDIFDNVLRTITMKSNTKEYEAVKNKLNLLSNLIIQLQKLVVKTKTDLVKIKNAREKCYATLASIYEDLKNNAQDIDDLEDAHLFLLNVNEKLMSALKSTHTGNDRIIPPDGCFCRRGQCASMSCTPACKRACVVNPKLTKYWCKGTVHNNISVSLDAICNGVSDCPFDDDEAKCSKDVCRKHHLVLIRHQIRDVGQKDKGTSLGETLSSWKTKVLSAIKITENNYRPAPNNIRDLVGDMLQDLVMAYAAMDDSRRHGDRVFNEFFSISQQTIESLKSCGK